MKRWKWVAVTILVAANGTAHAQTAVGTGVGVSQSNSAAGAVAVSGQGGQGGNVTIAPQPTTTTQNINSSGTTTQNVNSRVSGTQTLRNVPLVAAPGLSAAGLETCLGSVSGGLGIVGFGGSFGTTVPDQDCAARLDARTLAQVFGLKAAAVVRMCQRPNIWNSMPDVCQRYWPAGMPAPQGAVIIAPVLASSGGPVEVILQKTGEHRMCRDYDEIRRRCRVWAR